jgi:hypothetical protein
MNTPSQPSNDKLFVARALEATIHIGPVVLPVPTYMLSGSLIDTAKEYSAQLEAGTLSVPPPSESVRSWPVIGEPLYEFWSLV